MAGVDGGCGAFYLKNRHANHEAAQPVTRAPPLPQTGAARRASAARAIRANTRNGDEVVEAVRQTDDYRAW